MGEVAKVVPIARGRVRSVMSVGSADGTAELRVVVAGVAGESVTLGYFNASAAPAGSPRYLTCIVSQLGTVQMQLVGGRCVE